MKKVNIIAHRHDQPKIVGELQNAGLVEIRDIPEEVSVEKGVDGALFASRAEQLGLELTKVQFVIDFLKRIKPIKKGMIAGFIRDRVLLDIDRFKAIDKKLDFEDLYQKCEDIDGRLGLIDRDRDKLKNDRLELLPWMGLGVPLNQLKLSKYMGLAVGAVKHSDLDKLKDALRKECEDAHVAFEQIHGSSVNLIILYFRRHKPAVDQALSAANFENIDLSRWETAPEDELRKIEDRIAELDGIASKLKEEAVRLAPLLDDVMILHDWLQSRELRYAAQSRFGRTNATFVLTGWVETANIESVRARLRALSVVVDFTFSDPEPGDNVPIVLINHKWLRPFEILTRLYGVPGYNEIDPTPTMGIFFFIFFGLALGDFGYGLVLSLFCLWMRRKFLMSEAGHQWLDVFILGGVASMVIGVLTGSYFGIALASLPSWLKALVVIDPLDQAFIFLIITWIVGIIQIITGLLVELWDSWRNNNYAKSIYESLPLILLFVSAVAALAGWMAVTVFGSTDAIYETILTTAVTALGITGVAYIILSGGFFSGYIAVIARLTGRSSDPEAGGGRGADVLASLVLTAVTAALIMRGGPTFLTPIALIAVIVGLIGSRSVRQALGNLGIGLYNLYGMSSYIGDILSYSRLMALGLATFLIGFVINTLAGLIAGFSPGGVPIGILLALAIAIPLHIVNLAINLLGAFVHPLRLQFVEYFSKFYEDGGKPFRPLAFKTDNLLFEEE